MAKYRTLRLEELQMLETEFIRFLAAQSITAADYRKIILDDRLKQKELIERFSDVVFTKTLSNIKILEQRTPFRIIFYTFHEDFAEMYGFEIEKTTAIDLRFESDLNKLMALAGSDLVNIHWIKGRKKYIHDKYREIFLILEQQSSIIKDDTLYQFIRQKFENLS